MARNEKTSMRIAKEASALLRTADEKIQRLRDLKIRMMSGVGDIESTIQLIKAARSIAASALTQVEDHIDIAAAQRVLKKKNRTWTQAQVEASLAKKPAKRRR